MIASNRYRILLVDDQDTIHQDYRKVLGPPTAAASELGRAAAALFDDLPDAQVEWEGFDLDSAFQGQEALALVQKSIDEGRRYAMAFVDVRMPPGWDGIQTVQQLWQVDPELLVVICSAYSDYSWEEMVGQLGRSDRFLILKKPFDNIEVRQCAMALTERWSVSRTDALTGLLNRRAFQGHCELEWDRAVRHRLPLACVMLDLDFFKRINDTLGHQAGDFVLQVVARELQANCRANDYVCRFGGEELCILLPHSSEEGAAAHAEKARKLLESELIRYAGQEIQLTASFGVAERLESGDDGYLEMLDRADQSLLVAKKLGRNQVVRFSQMSESGRLASQQSLTNGLFRTICARHLMTTPTACFQEQSTVGDAASFFLQFRINSAPVVDAEGKLVGIVSEKDIIGVLSVEDSWNKPIRCIMQRNVVCYDEDTPASAICDFLSRVAVRRVVIVRDGMPVGVVSRGSLLRWYANWINVHQPAQGPTAAQTSDVARQRMLTGTTAVSRCAVDLHEQVAAQLDDPVAPMIDRVSKLQELINDLLTSWHYANLPPVIDDEDYLRAARLIIDDTLPATMPPMTV